MTLTPEQERIISESEPETDFEQELQSWVANASEGKVNKPVETTEAVEENPEENLRKQILQAFHSKANKPSDADISRWKQQHGADNLWVVALSENDVFVITCIRRNVFKSIRDAVQKVIQGGAEIDADEAVQEKTIQAATLWPKLNASFFHTSKAGIIPTLYQVIMTQSLFLQVPQAMMLTTPL